MSEISIRYIPKKTRVKTEFIRGITAGDLIWLACGITAVFLLAFIGLGAIGYVLAGVVAVFVGLGILRSKDGERMYTKIWLWFKFLAYGKNYAKIDGGSWKPMKEIVGFEKLYDDKYISFGTYYGAVIEIKPVEFGLLDPTKQDIAVNQFANAMRRLTEKQSASIISMERSLVLDKYIDSEIEKYENMARNVESGALSEDELEAREIIFNERGALLEYMNEDEKVYRNAFYMIVYDSDRNMLEQTIQGIQNTMTSGIISIETIRLEGKELAVFLKNNFDKEFNEREVREITEEKMYNWIVPNKIQFGTSKVKINKTAFTNITVTDYPLEVANAWAYGIFNMPGCRTVMNFRLVDKLLAEKLMDRAIIEMKTQMYNSKKATFQVERQTQLETINNLLLQIKRGNEAMFDANIHITCEWEARKEAKAKLKEEGFRFSELFGQQVTGFVSSAISRLEALDGYTRGIPTTTLAANFPFISDLLQDEKGICLGSNSYPVFIDFFKRNNVRVNSNMIVIGKSGSGKSFATKTILAHLAADNTKIFICDPEKEYTTMAEKLHGSVIDVGNAGKGRFNPFHVYPAMLDDDDNGAEFDDTFESHLRFLESFFKIVMEGIRADALEALNGLVAALYKTKGIDKFTDFAHVRPDQFPTFQNLYDLAKKFHISATDEFSKINYRILITYLEKFAEGGRYSGLWNGPATIRPGENFVVFNFLTLLANKNSVVANAQMLLVFKYLDGEIIKNREYNIKHKTNRKIIIVVDEAHVFIDEQRPIALDFMFNMAKRIRKYGGMQIIITQNVKDFVGSPAIAKKSAAIINASQYSMIFSLAPNDMSDLVTLYKNSGEINKSEQNQIVGNQRGQCFFISGPSNRTLINIEASEAIQKIFE